MPKYVTSTEGLGRAMLAVARDGYAKQRLEAADISAVASGVPTVARGA